MKTFLIMSALAFGFLLAGSIPSEPADAMKPEVRATTVRTVNVPPGPPKHANYECSMGSCTCTNSKDCATMGADHVCVEGTFRQGTCTEKKY